MTTKLGRLVQAAQPFSLIPEDRAMLRTSQPNLSLAAVVVFAVLCGSPAMSQMESDMKLGVDGVGHIGTSAFDLQSLRADHREFQWEQAERMTESGLQPTIIAQRGGTPAMIVVGDGYGRISKIEIVDRQIGNWLGPRIADPYQALRRNLQLGACKPGAEQLSGAVLCTAAESSRVTYVFSGRWYGPDGQLPPETILDHWIISKMLWSAGSVAQQPQQTASSPSFDCAGTLASIEEMICDDPELMALDRRLNTLFVQRIESVDAIEASRLRAFQRGWIKARNDCYKGSGPRQCVIGMYNDRIAKLSAGLPHQFAGTAWQVMRIAGDHVPKSINVNVTFGADGNLNGASGCNRYFAPYTIENQEVRIGQIGGTRKLCPDPEMVAERRFLDALRQVNGWATHGVDLVLYGTGAELTLRRQ